MLRILQPLRNYRVTEYSLLMLKTVVLTNVAPLFNKRKIKSAIGLFTANLKYNRDQSIGLYHAIPEYNYIVWLLNAWYISLDASFASWTGGIKQKAVIYHLQRLTSTCKIKCVWDGFNYFQRKYYNFSFRWENVATTDKLLVSAHTQIGNSSIVYPVTLDSVSWKQVAFLHSSVQTGIP
jgi:hypothetical protein